MFHFKHFTSLQWFGFISILSLVGMIIMAIFTPYSAPLAVKFANVILAGFAIVFIEWPSKDGFKSDSRKAAVSIDHGMQSRFNPIEGKSAQEIILWFQDILEVELNLQNYTLAENAINLHLINNPTPSIKSVLDDLECIEPLKAFAFELKKNLLY